VERIGHIYIIFVTFFFIQKMTSQQQKEEQGDSWLLVRGQDSWTLVDAIQNDASYKQKYITISDNDGGSRTSLSDEENDNNRRIIFQPGESPVSSKPSNFMIQPTRRKTQQQQQDLLAGLLIGSTNFQRSGSDATCGSNSSLESDNRSILSALNISDGAIKLLKTDDDLDVMNHDINLFGESVHQTKEALLLTCIQQLRDANKKSNHKNIINTLQMIKTIFGLGSVLFLVIRLLTKNREDVRRWFRSSPEVYVGLGTLMLDSLEPVATLCV